MIEHPIFMVPLVTGDEVTAARTPEEICDDAIETFLARYRPKERSRKQAFAYPAAGKVLAAEP
jgi:hypothetical protein